MYVLVITRETKRKHRSGIVDEFVYVSLYLKTFLFLSTGDRFMFILTSFRNFLLSSVVNVRNVRKCWILTITPYTRVSTLLSMLATLVNCGRR